MNEQEFIKRAFTSGLNPQQVSQAVQLYRQKQPQGNWLTGTRTSVPGKIFEAAGNILSIPSYAVGGMMDEFQKKGVGALNPLKNPLGLAGAFSGIKNKEAVIRELPESFGLDPDTGAGLALGFAGELLTPGMPVGKLGKVANVFRGGKAASRIAKPNVSSNVGKEMGQRLLTSSYGLNKTDFNSIADAIGVTKESEKMPKVLEYLQGLGLTGSHPGSLKKLESITSKIQKDLNKMVKTGTPIDRKAYSDALFNKAAELEKTADDIDTRRIVLGLVDEAQRQEAFANQGVGMTDTMLRKTITKSFKGAGDTKMSDPLSSSLKKEVGFSGLDAMETQRPGSKLPGQKLHELYSTLETIGDKSRTGFGTQVINAFKPGVTTAALGAGVGYSQGQDPVKSGILGFAGGIAATNPRTLNLAGRALSGGLKVNPAISSGFSAGMKYARKVPVTVARIGGANLTNQQDQQNRAGLPRQSQQEATRRQQLPLPTSTQPTTYGSSIPSSASSSTKLKPIKYEEPKSVFSNKSTFGKTKKVQRGSFY